MEKNIIFRDDNNMLSVELLYIVDMYYTYEISVWTNGFSGKCNFCIMNSKKHEYLEEIDVVNRTLSGSVEIQDCESDSYLKLYFENPMNFYLVGQLGGSYEDNRLNFKMKADQTLLLGLKKKLIE